MDRQQQVLQLRAQPYDSRTARTAAWLTVWVLVMSMLSAAPAAADQIGLRNGDLLTGNLVGFAPGVCLFKTSYTRATLSIDLRSVKSLRTATTRSIRLRNGDHITGTIEDLSEGTLSVHSPQLGRLSVEAGKVAAVSDVAQRRPTSAGTPWAPEAGAQEAGPGGRPSPPHPGTADRAMRLGSAGMEDSGQKPLEATPRALHLAATEPVPSQPAPAANTGRAGVIGQEQRREQEDQERIFLRQTTVLLRPGEIEGDFALQYRRLGAQGDVLRQVIFAPTLRAGVLDRLEAFVGLPFGWSQHEISTPGGNGSVLTDSREKFGLADMSFGLKYLLVQEGEAWPDIIVSLSGLAPTGDAEDPFRAFPLNLGGGRWRLGTGLSFVRSYDPAVLFGGLGYSHAFDASVDGAEISGGHIFSYDLGLGFALNDRLTVSGQFAGAYATQLRRSGETISSNREVFLLRSAMTYRFASGQYIEPSITYAVNRDASDVVLGVSYVRRF